MAERGPGSTWLQEGMIRSNMLGKTMLPGDAELGKKDDDHRFAPPRRSAWATWVPAFRWRRRRSLFVVVSMVLVYLVLWSSPTTTTTTGPTATTHTDVDDIPGYHPAQTKTASPNKPAVRAGRDDDDEPAGPPPDQTSAHEAAKPHSYDGPIRFFRLGETLRKHATYSAGYLSQNKNVLFAMSNPKSVSTLLPMICEMANWKRNLVHVVFMARQDIPLEDILDINGVDSDSCPVTWHDARPDYVEYSSDARAESAVAGAITHIRKYLHPQVAITDDLDSEDAFFARGIRSETEQLGMPLIQIPKGKAQDLMWMTRLDTGSLSAWHETTVDIVVQVPSDSSNVLGMLRSMILADYSGLKPPHITLELPAQMDQSVRDRLVHVEWPPSQNRGLAGSSLTMRRRITTQRATQEESAMRFLELYYPTDTAYSHVVLLSPEVQLSRQYYHFIMYTLLEYKFSTYAEGDNRHVLGISLELPSVLPDGKTELVLPQVVDMHATRYLTLYSRTESAPFLWQAPNSHAALFLGDKWAEFHSFLRNRVAKHRQSPKAASRPKLVSETLPAWAEYMLEFMRVRGYSLLYPATMTNALVTVHTELYHVPEEFSLQSPRKFEATPEPGSDEPFILAEERPPAPKNRETRVSPKSEPLHLDLPFNGDLPEVPHLPLLLYNGQMMNPANTWRHAAEVAAKFRTEVGGCKIPKGKHKKFVAGDTSDLFCFGDEDEEDWEDDLDTSWMDDDLDDDDDDDGDDDEEYGSWLDTFYHKHGGKTPSGGARTHSSGATSGRSSMSRTAGGTTSNASMQTSGRVD